MFHECSSQHQSVLGHTPQSQAAPPKEELKAPQGGAALGDFQLCLQMGSELVALTIQRPKRSQAFDIHILPTSEIFVPTSPPIFRKARPTSVRAVLVAISSISSCIWAFACFTALWMSLSVSRASMVPPPLPVDPSLPSVPLMSVSSLPSLPSSPPLPLSSVPPLSSPPL